MTSGGPDTVRVRVLVVGQTPPPFGGQAIMIQRMLDHSYDGVELHHVRMAFSQQISDAGKFQVQKIAHLLSVILRVAWSRVRYRTTVLYYPPAGPNRVPVFRDIAILVSTRWMFRHTIFHFHATDLPAIYPTLTGTVRRLFRAAYWAPDLAIATSEYNLADGMALDARREVVIPNCLGADDLHATPRESGPDGPCRLLFVGLLTSTKGVEDILEASEILLRWGCQFEVVLVGPPASPEFENLLKEMITRLGIGHVVTLTGELSGSDVDAEYERGDVFVFPTRLRSESFGIVLLEAMAHGLPLVGSGLGGVRSIIRDGLNGMYVPSNDPVSLAVALERLIRDPGLRARMGDAGLQLMHEEYSPEAFYTRMNGALLSVA